jgi:hypothetical protein
MGITAADVGLKINSRKILTGVRTGYLATLPLV